LKRSAAFTFALFSLLPQAGASTDVYLPRNPTTDLQQATQLCYDDWGMVTEERPATSEYKRCMANYGWIYARSEKDRPEKAGIDSDYGDYHFHDIRKPHGRARGVVALRADSEACTVQTGHSDRLADLSATQRDPAYRKCLLVHGWAFYAYTPPTVSHSAAPVKHGRKWFDATDGIMKEDTPD
jgi:hypothetical protein